MALTAAQRAVIDRSLSSLPGDPFDVLPLGGDVTLNGLTFNTIDSDDVLWVVTDIDGWWNVPDPDVRDYPRGGQDGSYDVQGRWTARQMTLTGLILPASPQSLPAARDNLVNALNMVHSGGWLRVEEDPAKVSYVRLSGRPQIRTTNARGRTEFSIGLRAADPIKYAWNDADPDGYYSTTIPAQSNTNTGSGTITNEGNTPVRCIIEVHGPIVGPAAIQNVTTGELILIIVPLASDDVLEIDTYRQEVALNGDTYGIRSALDAPTNWIRLTPGANAFDFEDLGAANPDPAPTITVYYRSGWIA